MNEEVVVARVAKYRYLGNGEEELVPHYICVTVLWCDEQDVLVEECEKKFRHLLLPRDVFTYEEYLEVMKANMDDSDSIWLDENDK